MGDVGNMKDDVLMNHESIKAIPADSVSKIH
jgi:hypothetical protein